MSKLWIFGDSFSDACGLHQGHPYVDFLNTTASIKNPKELSWQNLVSKELDLELKECAVSGCSNSQIIIQIILNINNFSKNDYIIVGWTQPTRIALPSPVGYYSQPLISIANESVAESIDKTFEYTNYKDFYLKTFLPVIDSHSNHWISIGMELVKFLSNDYNLKSWFWGYHVNQIESIEFVTNKTILDGHPSINGHVQIKNIINNMEWGSLVDLNRYTLQEIGYNIPRKTIL